MSSQPLVTVGLMAYNEEAHLSHAIESIVNQGYKNVEIIIGDNCSTDGTQAIAEKYAAENERVKYMRHERNLGVIENFNRLVRAGKGKYFVLAGAHDLWSDKYLEELVAGMEARPKAVHGFGMTQWIDNDGNPADKYSGMTDTSGFDVFRRFWIVASGNQNSMYGIYLMEALKKTRLQLQIFGSGMVMLVEMAMMGEFIYIPGPIWYRRMNRKPETHRDRRKRYRRILYKRKRIAFLPHWAIPWALWVAIWRAKLRFLDRLLLLWSFPFVFALYFRNMMQDIAALFGIGGK